MAGADPRVKKLKIQTGVVKRITKEKEMYEKEAVGIEQKIEKLKTENACEYVIRKQQEVLQESKQMVPETLKRLNVAYTELLSIVTNAEDDLKEMEEMAAAQSALSAAKPLVDA